MDVATFARYANQIDKYSSNTIKTNLLSQAFSDAGEDLAPATLFFQGQTFPMWDDRKVKVGPKLMQKAIAKATGTSQGEVDEVAAEVGDTGEAIEALGIDEDARKQVLFSEDVDLSGVADKFADVATMSGSGSQQRKIDALADLFLRLEDTTLSEEEAFVIDDSFQTITYDEDEQEIVDETPIVGATSSYDPYEPVVPDEIDWEASSVLDGELVDENGDEVEYEEEVEPYTYGEVTITAEEQAKYIIRLVLDEMRIGVGQGTVRDAIGEAFGVDADLVERGIMLRADVGEVGEVARNEGSEGLKNLSMTLGRPVEAMLAVTGEIDDSVEEWGSAVAETKYDGARLMAHKDGDDVYLFTRGLEDVTDSLPDVVNIVQQQVDAETAILDSEVVAYDEEGNPMEFTKIMERLGRKYDIDEKQEEITVNVQVFDILYCDGEVVMEDPLTDRFEEVQDIAPDLAADHIESDDPAEIRDFEAQSLSQGNEGIMLKKPDSQYSPGKRGQNWRKVKPEVETLDCVVIGGEWGEGKRANVEHPETGEEVRTIGSYKLGILDDNGVPQSIGKVATGLTDAQLVRMTELFEDLIVDEDGKDVTFEHEVVFEVGYEELQPSPEYGSGFGLRFPRFLGVRDDKRVEDADTVERVERLHEEQQ